MSPLHRPTRLTVERLEGRAVPAVFYVAPTGSDTAAGSDAAPWRTLQRAADAVRAGDSVIVRAGDYAGFVLGWDVPQDGTAAAPIAFRADPGVRITSRNARTADGINLEGTDFVTVEGFTVVNPGGSITRAGIRSVNNRSVVIRNNAIDGMGTWGVLTGFSESVVIEGNTTSRSGNEHGIYVSNSADNPVIRNNTSWGNRANGIHMNGDASLGGDGIISGALVEGNVIYGNGAGGGSGINCDGVQNSRFRNNLIYSTLASGISLYRIDGGGGSTGNVVVNNTVLVAAGTGRWALNIQNGSTGNTVYNNVLLTQHATRGSISISTDSLPGFVSDYNVVADRFTTDGGTTRRTLDWWRTNTGQDTHSRLGTPADTFVDVAANNYRPKPGGPAVDAGTATLAPFVDLTGAARPQGAGYDAGAYELAAAPRVADVRLNDGTEQRSMVRSLTVTFGGAVTLGPSAFVVTPRGGGPAVPLSVVPTLINGVTVATIAFTGAEGGSLTDGHWELRTVASEVRDAGGTPMAADRVDAFHRLFGDGDGDRDVDSLDLLRLRTSFGLSSGQTGYRPEFDFDGDSDVDNLDLLRLRQRFNVMLPP